MKINQEIIEQVRLLARLELTPQEMEAMERELTTILDYMDILNELDLSEVSPTAHTLGYINVMREDIIKPGLDIETVSRMAPQWEEDHFVVPRVV